MACIVGGTIFYALSEGYLCDSTRDGVECWSGRVLGRSLYFTIVTITTVGYGDVTPSSTFGRVGGGAVDGGARHQLVHVLDVDALLEHVAAKLAKFKVPTIVEVSDEPLPRNASGKILKKNIRDVLVARRE